MFVTLGRYNFHLIELIMVYIHLDKKGDKKIFVAKLCLYYLYSIIISTLIVKKS